MIEAIKNILFNLDLENSFSDYMLFVLIVLTILMAFAIIIVGGIEFLAKKFNFHDKIADFFKSDEDIE